jgi:hypothetical protein
MKFNVWMIVWETTEIVYKYTRIRIQAPVEYFYPDFGPWLFGKMIGTTGIKIKENCNVR